MVEVSTKCVKRGENGLKLGENAISPMWKKHQNLLSNNSDAATRPNSCTARALCLSPPQKIRLLFAQHMHSTGCAPPMEFTPSQWRIWHTKY